MFSLKSLVVFWVLGPSVLWKPWALLSVGTDVCGCFHSRYWPSWSYLCRSFTHPPKEGGGSFIFHVCSLLPLALKWLSLPEQWSCLIFSSQETKEINRAWHIMHFHCCASISWNLKASRQKELLWFVIFSLKFKVWLIYTNIDAFRALFCDFANTLLRWFLSLHTLCRLFLHSKKFHVPETNIWVCPRAALLEIAFC